MATHSNILAWRIPIDRGAWWATAHKVAESDTTQHTAQHVFKFSLFLRERRYINCLFTSEAKTICCPLTSILYFFSNRRNDFQLSTQPFKIKIFLGFPGGSLVKKKIPCQFRRHWVQSLPQEDPHAAKQLSPSTTPIEPMLQSRGATTTEPKCRNY